jgi:cytochrome c-type biogenesis protein
MGGALLTGSALAAFLAGMVAFFAPCCAFVMLPTYLASVTGASRWRTAALTAVFTLGVATVVWPLTVGAAGLSQLISANHETMFLLGGLMMLVVGAATLRGWMWNHAPSVGGGDPKGVVGVYMMGVFAGAATACCAPVLAGAIAIAGVSGSWWAGAVLGLFYLFGLVSPLLLSAAGIGKLRGRLRDPKVVFSLAGRRVRMTLSRMVGGIAFIALGTYVIVLAVTGEAKTAPGFQKAFGQWLAARASDLNSAVPARVGWALMLSVALGVSYLAVRSLRRPAPAAAGAVSPRSCCETHQIDNTTHEDTERSEH